MYRLYIKRIIDVIFSLVIIVMLFPIFLFISILITVESPGNPIFVQKRITKEGKLFDMYKFRSMYIDSEKKGTGLFNYKDDPRVTKIGKIMRSFSIDELPQFFNVLKGDMSLIGPRPPVEYELGSYEKLNNRYKKRFQVLAGITGLAQISGRNEISWDVKVDYDNMYVDLLAKDGMITDLKIILKTIVYILKRNNIYENKENSLDESEAADLSAAEIIYKAQKPD